MFHCYPRLLAGFCFLYASSLCHGQEIYVTIPPLKYFVQEITAEAQNVGVVLAPGQNPHSYSPSAKQIASLTRAKLLFTTGVPFEEHFISKIKGNSSTLKIIPTDEKLPKRKFTHHEAHDHDHHHHHDHKGNCIHADWDPHIWMSPQLAIKQSQAILDALVIWKPSKKEVYQANFKALEKELNTLHDFLATELSPLKGSSLYVYHPAFGYFADAYGLEQKAIEVQGKQPTAKQLKTLIEQAKSDRAQVIFVQKQFPTSSAQTVADAIQGVVIPLDPLSADYLSTLKKIGTTISKNFTK
ncbi:MAG: zinc ABC transporter substrate-binding protein [Verrucomicrobiota bacterium]